MIKQPYFPAILIAGLLAGMMGTLILTQHLAQKDLYFVNKIFLGLDYRDFHIASALIQDGQSPYP